MSARPWLHRHSLSLTHSAPPGVQMGSKLATGDNAAGNLGGLLAEVYVWSAPTTQTLLALLVNGFDYLDPALPLLAHYPLEEGTGAVAGACHHLPACRV